MAPTAIAWSYVGRSMICSSTPQLQPLSLSELTVKAVDYELTTTGAGGTFSCIDDLAKWDNALSNYKVVSEKTFARAITPVIEVSEGRSYGYGWFMSRTQDMDVHGHSGGLPGFATLYLRCPAKKTSVVLLTNQSGFGPLGEIAAKVLDFFVAPAATR